MQHVRVVVEHGDGLSEYIVHVNNRSKHSLQGAVRAGWKRYPAARAVSAQFVHEDCGTCNRVHNTSAVRRVFKRVPKRERKTA